MRYSSIVEIDNIQSHPQRFLKGIIINNCNYSRLKKVKKRFEPEVKKIKFFLANQNINCAKIDDYYYYGDENSINIVYEYIKGKELTEESWNEAKIIYFLKNILPTLQKLHENKIVHGNIKPSNFLEQNSNYFLLDFGFVTKISELTFDEQDNIENEPLQGTEGYRAKEVQEGFEAQPYSDIYSLGITIIELLTAKSPQKFKNQDDEIIWELVKEISPNFRQILKKMVESNDRNRYNNAEEVLNAIEDMTRQGTRDTPSDPQSNDTSDTGGGSTGNVQNGHKNGKKKTLAEIIKQFIIYLFSLLKKPKFYWIVFGIIVLFEIIQFTRRDYLKAYKTFEEIQNDVNIAHKKGIADEYFYETKLNELDKEVLPVIRLKKNEDERVRAYRGFLLGKLNRHEESFIECEKAVSHNPNFYQGFNCLGSAELALGELKQKDNQLVEATKHFEKARDYFNKVIELLKKYPDSEDLELAYYNKASALISLEKEEEAKEAINEIKKINPQSKKSKSLCQSLKKTKCD